LDGTYDNFSPARRVYTGTIRAMAKLTLFAYAQGIDLEGVAETVEARLDGLVGERSWVSKDVWVVNQRHEGKPPEWDLGLNLALAAPRTRPAAWKDDVVAIAKALGELHRDTGRKFVIGIHDDKTDTTKDLFVVDSDTPDLEKLKTALT
jgi:hypothetical protein